MALFQHFEYKEGMLVIEVYWQLRGKYCQRLMMQGGPFIQPEDFFLVVPPEDHSERLEREVGPLSKRNHHLIPYFMNDAHALNLEDAVENILSEKRMRFPIVIKPDSAALGEGIIFIEKNDALDYRVSMKMPDNGPLGRGVPYAVAFLWQQPFERLSSEHDNLMVVGVPKQEIHNLLSTLLSRAHVTKRPYKLPDTPQIAGEYSTLFVESFISSWKYQGLAYETRHKVAGNLETGDIHKVSDDHARVGGSHLFANQWLARDETKGDTIGVDTMYEPLLCAYDLTPCREEFRRNVHDNLRAAFDHYAKQLRRAGFHFNGPSELQIDLMWTPPPCNGKYPQAAMTECEWVHSNPDLWSPQRTPLLVYKQPSS